MSFHFALPGTAMWMGHVTAPRTILHVKGKPSVAADAAAHEEPESLQGSLRMLAPRHLSPDEDIKIKVCFFHLHFNVLCYTYLCLILTNLVTSDFTSEK